MSKAAYQPNRPQRNECLSGDAVPTKSDYFIPDLGPAELRRLDAIADRGTQFTDRNESIRMFEGLPVTAMEIWAFELGTRETLHMLDAPEGLD